jgi:methylenetetrahydrofolate reductase (NADPH)
MFLPSSDWEELKAKLTSEKYSAEVSFYASNAKGEFISSDTVMAHENEVSRTGASTNAVTWGAFPGKEIITPTIIEEVSFRAWAEEAFGIWEEWANVYAARGGETAQVERGKASKKLIESVREDVWLVNIIHHGFVEKEGLWDLLLS